MNDHKKQLGRKRQKIFSIEKVPIKGIPKNLSKQKNKLFPIGHLFSSKERISPTLFQFNSNLEESQDKYSSENQRHSLISISKLVFEYLNQRVNTTGNEVTEHIKKLLKPKKNDQSNQKNIQRRVYDAINVMCAVGLIKKNKQEIQFLIKLNKENNNNSNINNNIININSKTRINKAIKEEKEKMDINEQIKKKSNELNEKRKKLIELFLTLKFYEKYTNLNDTFPQRKRQKKMEFPFDLIRYDKSYPIKIIPKEDLSRILILSNSKLTHLSPYDAIKGLVSLDLLSKLNENNLNENNTNQIKSSSKKSTNDESLLDEINLNFINNLNEIKEKKENEEDPKKIKIFNDPFNDFSCIISNETKNQNEMDDALTFNYLKPLKIFKDELTINENIQNELNDIANNNNCKEEIDNNIEKENDNSFIENRFRKNSNASYGSNLYDENTVKQNKVDCMSEIGLYN